MTPYGHIYGLTEPGTGEVRYVGFSTDVEKRYRWHLNGYDAPVTHRKKWILSLVERGLQPGLVRLQDVSEGSWQKAEQSWIAFFRREGHELTNATDGGEGTQGHIFTDKQRQRVGEASKRAWTPARKARHSALMKGNKHGCNGRGLRRTAEQRKNISEGMKRSHARRNVGRTPSRPTLNKTQLKEG